MGNILEEIVNNKEELLIKFLQILEGKEAKANVNLDGIEFQVGESVVKINGNVEFTFVPFGEKRK